ncbi:MMPL family transporter [Streptomyces sp. G44]|uniref:MMPL family transporter n=1 Tax=Streptomyces sp. G44 TaxID=2807632 RepID=UPI001960EED7|nr:MMPL family transporter [Streptomyces sp. G44]MBM7166867.1 MMPL family transporter [Streptomyces sp. G44]
MTLLMGTFGIGGLDRLGNTGAVPPDSAVARSSAVLAERYGVSEPDLVLLLQAASDVQAPEVTATGRAVEQQVREAPGVAAAFSYWTTRDPALLSRDAASALVVVDLSGGEARRTETAKSLVTALGEQRGPVRISATGPAWTYAEMLDQNRSDLLRAELVSAPLGALILLFVFRSLVAAMLPVVSALVATSGTLASMRLLTSFMDVSVYASNVTTALGFGLAVDYGILVVTRFREESADGAQIPHAISRSVRTAGRAVLASASIVVASLSALLFFPMAFLRSVAWAGIAVVVFSAAASVIVIPALLALFGRNIDRWDVFAPFRRRGRHSAAAAVRWRRVTLTIIRRPVMTALAATAVLGVMSLPAIRVVLGPNSVEDLPRNSTTYTTAVAIREDFDSAPERQLTVGLPNGTPRDVVDHLARTLSAQQHTAVVRSFTGQYRGGTRVEASRPWNALQDTPGGPLLTVTSRFPPHSDESAALVRQIRSLPVRGTTHVTGEAAQVVDALFAAHRALPWSCGFAAVATMVLMALFTRSLLVPLKAVAVAGLSMAATLGFLVYVFQEGHLRSLFGDFGVTGYLSGEPVVFLLATTYALSVDYEVFIVARIREEYLASGDNTAAVVEGMQHTARLVTAASLVFAAAMAGPAMSHVTPLKFTGLGLAFAVLVDAVLVRGALVPSLMTLAGRANWWLPSVRRAPRTADEPAR